MARVRGFTLIELMIVVVIIAILASIAIPSYNHYIQRSRRSDALAALSQDQSILERCYAQNFDYKKVTVAGSGCGSLSQSTPTLSPSKYYGVTVAFASTSATAQSSYTLTAVPATGSPQLKDTQCASFGVTNANVRSATDSSGNSGAAQTAECWRQ
jgi:type IV pilus assembly protein PilE